MRILRTIGIISVLVLTVSLSLGAEEKPLASERLIQALAQEVSGEIAYQYTVLISHFDRIQASQGWHDAAQMIKTELERMGYQDAVIEGWPSNGSRYYYTYQTPIGWRASHGELWMISPRKEKLCSYEEVPLTLVKHSNAAKVKAELIDVGTGVGEQTYRHKDVKGKIVLATAYSGEVMREAVVKRGALGVITWYPPEVRPGYPNMIRYTAVWPRWEERNQIGFGFNVSKSQGWNLKKMLEDGEKVVLHAEVEAEYYDSQIEALSVTLPGQTQPDEEVMIIGHLCHPTPSANDNASGSGGMLEMARALKKMIDRGLVPPPRRTIRFLWVPEFYGTIPYIQSHLERTRKTLSVINCDMIGEDLHLTGGTFNITCTPDSMPSYLNDVVVNFTKLAERLRLRSLNGSNHPFAYRVQPFSGGSDHLIFNDGALKVPAVMFGHGDTFHHTSLDTPDKVDASELRRICFIALGTSYYLANASTEEAKAMARLIARNGLGRLASDYYDSLNALFSASNSKDLARAYDQALNVIIHSNQRETEAVCSTKKFFRGDDSASQEITQVAAGIKNLSSVFKQDVQRYYQNFCTRKKYSPASLSLTPEEKKLSKIIPVRSVDFVCPLQMGYLEDKLGRDALSEIRLSGYAPYEALNFVDGTKDVYAISRAVSAELGRVEARDIYVFFQVLEKAQLISFREK